MNEGKEDDGKGKGDRKTEMEGEKKKEHFVSLPEADLLTSWLIFSASHCSGAALHNTYQIYWYI